MPVSVKTIRHRILDRCKPAFRFTDDASVVMAHRAYNMRYYPVIGIAPEADFTIDPPPNPPNAYLFGSTITIQGGFTYGAGGKVAGQSHDEDGDAVTKQFTSCQYENLSTGQTVSPTTPFTGTHTLSLTLSAYTGTNSVSETIRLTVKDSDGNEITKEITLTVIANPVVVPATLLTYIIDVHPASSVIRTANNLNLSIGYSSGVALTAATNLNLNIGYPAPITNSWHSRQVINGSNVPDQHSVDHTKNYLYFRLNPKVTIVPGATGTITIAGLPTTLLTTGNLIVVGGNTGGTNRFIAANGNLDQADWDPSTGTITLNLNTGHTLAADTDHTFFIGLDNDTNFSVAYTTGVTIEALDFGPAQPVLSDVDDTSGVFGTAAAFSDYSQGMGIDYSTHTSRDDLQMSSATEDGTNGVHEIVFEGTNNDLYILDGPHWRIFNHDI